MIKLPHISADLLNEFYEDQKKSYKKLLEENNNNPNYSKIINYLSTNGQLDDSKIKDIIIGNRQRLENAIRSIGILTQNKSLKRGDPVVDFIRLYENFTGRKLGRVLADKIGVTVCPYCNRSYVFTLSGQNVRPQYDHFFEKSKYPYLAVSFYNLIPSCGVCNSAKHDASTYINGTVSFIYPYEDEYGYAANFKISSDNIESLLGGSEFTLQIDTSTVVNSALKQRIDKAKSLLNLEDLYNKHKDYVVDILRLNYINQEPYRIGLLNTFPNLFNRIEDVNDLLFLSRLSKEDWGKRILSKLTHDILFDVETLQK